MDLFNKILPSDYVGKTVEGKPNPLNGDVAENQRIFDQFNLEVTIPKVNAIVDTLNRLKFDIFLPTPDNQQYWNNKVDTVNGKTGTTINLQLKDIPALDDTTGQKYILGVDNGGLYFEEVI